MNQEKYIGMDVHQATISVAVMDAAGKLIMECLLETKAVTIVEFIQGLHGTLSLTFEEGTSVAWLHDLLKPLREVSRRSECPKPRVRLAIPTTSVPLQFQGLRKRTTSSSCKILRFTGNHRRWLLDADPMNWRLA